jgi:cytochrome b561
MRSKLASSIAILLNYGAKWRVLYYIFYVLCLDFNLGLLIDPQILYYNTYTNVELKSTLYMNTPLASNGPLQRVIGFSIFTRYLQDNQISTIYAVFIVITVVVCGLTSLFYFHYPSGAPLKYTRFMAVISNILCYYDYWYLIFFELFLRTFTCVPRFVEEKKLSLDTTNTSTTDDSQLRLVKISISSLNSNLQCWTVDHIFIGIMGAVILVCNICLKFINNKILTHRPNPRLPSKMSSADLMHLMLMVTIMLMKIIFSAAGYDRGIDLKLFYIICFGILLLDISIHTMARPFYSSKSNYLRSFEMVSVILILIITLVSLWSSPDSQPSANKIVTSQIVITMLLVLTAVMKLYSSLGEKIDWRGSSKKSKQQS